MILLPTKVVEAVAEDTGKGIKAQDAYTEYTTYILGEGAIGFEDVGKSALWNGAWC